MPSTDPKDIAALVLTLRSSIDTQFQTWLSITFAVIVATFASRERLRLGFRWLTAVLYLMASAALISRGVNDGIEAAAFIDKIQATDVALRLPTITILSRVLLVVIGTIGALMFVFMRHERLVAPSVLLRHSVEEG